MEQEKQKMKETSQEREARSEEGFDTVERTLPRHVGSRFNIPLIDNLSSYLGVRNPLARAANVKSDSVWLLDNTAYRPVHVYPHKPQPWQSEFVAAFFVRDSGKDISKWVADIADKIGITEDRPNAEATIAKRLQPLVAIIKPARFANVRFPTGDIQKLGPGGRDAISSGTFPVPGDNKDGDVIEVTSVPPALTPNGHMFTHFADPEGWAVISDIDDSIKITMTPSPVGILRSTFISKPTPIAGMPELYAHIQQALSPTWFYLSASPYNLYYFLRPFLHEFYPKGTLILREASWMNLAGFLASLTQGTEAYKSSRIDKIHDWLPSRKIICVGDSTQSDPEAYGDMYRKHKDWIKAIFIRKVMDVSEMNATQKNSDERFEKAFRDVPKDTVWRVFEGSKELYSAIDALKGATFVGYGL